MKLLIVTVATAAVLAFAIPQTTPALAQGADVGAASRPFPLDGGPSAGSDDHGQSSEKSEGSARSGDVSSEKNQTPSGKTGETELRGHRVAIHKHSHRIIAISHSRHHLLHRHGRHVVTMKESSGV
jgi:hypothetical protein